MEVLTGLGFLFTCSGSDMQETDPTVFFNVKCYVHILVRPSSEGFPLLDGPFSPGKLCRNILAEITAQQILLGPTQRM